MKKLLLFDKFLDARAIFSKHFKKTRQIEAGISPELSVMVDSNLICDGLKIKKKS